MVDWSFFFCFKPKQKLVLTSHHITLECKWVIISTLKMMTTCRAWRIITSSLIFSCYQMLCLFTDTAEPSDSFLWMPQFNFVHPCVPAVILAQWKTLKWDVFVISMKLGGYKKWDFEFRSVWLMCSKQSLHAVFQLPQKERQPLFHVIVFPRYHADSSDFLHESSYELIQLQDWNIAQQDQDSMDALVATVANKADIDTVLMIIQKKWFLWKNVI